MKKLCNILIFRHLISFITFTKASLQLEACSELRGLVTLSLLVMKERWVKLLASEDLWTYRKQAYPIIYHLTLKNPLITFCCHYHETLAQRGKRSPLAVTLQCWSVLTCWHHWSPSYFVCWLVGTRDQTTITKTVVHCVQGHINIHVHK